MTTTTETTPSANAAILGMSVGTRVQLRGLDDPGATEHFSSLIGYVKDEFLLVKLPVVRGSPVIFYDGIQILVRAFTGTTIYTFRATVQRTLLSPSYYMHLSYPSDVASATLRSALRVKVRIPARIEYTPPGKAGVSLQVLLVNLSTSGASIDCDAIVPVGQKLRCVFQIDIDGAEPGISVDAIVRSVNFRPGTAGQSADVFSCGVQFQEISNADETTIRLLSYERLLSDRQNIV
ncbi:MAG: flagellar brake protein [Herminiimonas sp.]|nr:flagellar brake protein [Herminiimonas sp.]